MHKALNRKHIIQFMDSSWENVGKFFDMHLKAEERKPEHGKDRP